MVVLAWQFAERDYPRGRVLRGQVWHVESSILDTSVSAFTNVYTPLALEVRETGRLLDWGHELMCSFVLPSALHFLHNSFCFSRSESNIRKICRRPLVSLAMSVQCVAAVETVLFHGTAWPARTWNSRIQLADAPASTASTRYDDPVRHRACSGGSGVSGSRGCRIRIIQLTKALPVIWIWTSCIVHCCWRIRCVPLISPLSFRPPLLEPSVIRLVADRRKFSDWATLTRSTVFFISCQLFNCGFDGNGQ